MHGIFKLFKKQVCSSWIIYFLFHILFLYDCYINNIHEFFSKGNMHFKVKYKEMLEKTVKYVKMYKSVIKAF